VKKKVVGSNLDMNYDHKIVKLSGNKDVGVYDSFFIFIISSNFKT
jgi:hypothetical protein